MPMTSTRSSTEDFRGTFEHQVWVGEQHSSDHLQSISVQNSFNRIYPEYNLKPKTGYIRISTGKFQLEDFHLILTGSVSVGVMFSSNLGRIINDTANIWFTTRQMAWTIWGQVFNFFVDMMVTESNLAESVSSKARQKFGTTVSCAGQARLNTGE